MKEYVGFRFILALLFILIFSILPLPEIMLGIRPPLILLFLLYIQFFLPSYSSPLFILIIGLCLDTLLATTFGQHAFAMLLTTWIAGRKARRFRFFTLVQQIALVGSFCLIYEGSLLLTYVLLGYQFNWIPALASAALGVILWPWLRLLGDSYLMPKVLYRYS